MLHCRSVCVIVLCFLQKAVSEMPDGASYAEYENAVMLAERRLNAAIAKAAQTAKDLKDHEEKLKVQNKLLV